jgi:hypothetical protein
MGHRTRVRTLSARQAGGTCIMTRAGVTGLARPSRAGSTHLEQHTIDLRLQLEEQGEDLAAARATNREFIAQLNSLHPTTRTKGRQ